MAEKLSQQAVGWLRKVFTREQEVKRDLGPRRPYFDPSGRDFNLLSLYGYDVVGDYLRLDHDLFTRFYDYEEMDDYPDLCLAGDSQIFTLKWGWTKIMDLVGRGSFWVLSYDRQSGSLVPAMATGSARTREEGHDKQMVEVVIDDGRTVRCTDGHMFMLKDESWVAAKDLKPNDRLMPGVVRLRNMSDLDRSYWEVHQPHEDSQLRASDGKRWVWLHRLVAEIVNGVASGVDVQVHHVDHNSLNNDPENLSGETRSSHAHHHIAGIDNTRYLPAWTDERRTEFSRRMLGNTRKKGIPNSTETRARMSLASKGRPKSAAHRASIGDAHRFDIPVENLEAALKQGGSIARAAEILNVSWSTARRHLSRHDLLNDHANHRVVEVRQIDSREEVFDLSVPGQQNFICNGVIVHNSAALDIYADDATQTDDEKHMSVWIESNNPDVQRQGQAMLKRVRAEEQNWEIARSLVKYGNDYEEMLVSDNGVQALAFMPPATVRRIEGLKSELLGFVQSYSGDFTIDPTQFGDLLNNESMQSGGETAIAFEGWRVAHARLRGKYRAAMYGHSILDPARWIWKRLMLLEDAVLVYKLTRSPSRFAFYVDTGRLQGDEALAYVSKVASAYKKRKFVNPKTGKLDLQFNPLSFDEDFFLPVGEGGKGTKVETLNGPTYASMEDVEYFLRKMHAAIKIPRGYLGFDENTPSRATLSQQDVRFARTVIRVQRELTNMWHHVYEVDLAARNIDPKHVDFDVKMATPSAIFELGNMEIRNARAQLAAAMDRDVSHYWIMSNIYGMNDDQIATIVKQRRSETLDNAKYDAEVQRSLALGAEGQPVLAVSKAGEPVPHIELPSAQLNQVGADVQMAQLPQGSQESRQGLIPEGWRAQYEGRYRGIVGMDPNARVRHIRRSHRDPYGITEQELTRGRSHDERDAKSQFEMAMRRNPQLLSKLEEVRLLVTELANSNRRSRTG